MNIKKNFYYFLHASRILCKYRSLPKYVTLFVTSKCNMRCSHCFYWKNINSIKNELEIDEIEKISKTMGNILLLMLTGGEPTLRPDLPEIAEIFCKNNNLLNLGIPTNGNPSGNVVSLIEKVLKKVRNTNINITLSLDGFETLHNQIRGRKDAYKSVVDTFWGLKDLKQRYNNLNIGICMTFMRENQNELASLYKFVSEKWQPDSVSLGIIRGKVKNSISKNIDIELFNKLSKQITIDHNLYKIKGYKGLPFSKMIYKIYNITRKIMLETIKTKKYIIPCYAGYLNAIIYPSGDLYFCELLKDKIGNLREIDYDFKKLWYSNRAYEIRNKIKKQKCFCIHDSNIFTNILFNPVCLLQTFFKGHR